MSSIKFANYAVITPEQANLLGDVLTSFKSMYHIHAMGKYLS